MDYSFRPEVFVNFPWFFFHAATVVKNTLSDGLWMWYEEMDGDTVKRHPCYEGRRGHPSYVVRSRKIKVKGRGQPLLDPLTGKEILRYDHFRELLLDRAWRVPVLLGKLPQSPATDASAEQKGTYAMFMMLLFRPWRSPSSAVAAWLLSQQICPRDQAQNADVVWSAMYAEFLRWRQDDIHRIAEPYFQRTGQSLATPAYDSESWWACMIYLRLSNLELVTSRKKSVKHSSPTEIFGVPVEETVSYTHLRAHET